MLDKRLLEWRRRHKVLLGLMPLVSIATEEHYSVLPQRMVGFDYVRKVRKAAEELVARIG